ncbi:MAG: lysozyme inhibitor LprI family protein [Terracidiphilus sp.]|nr:lysozyme inhibitor LprI family protein [Terracidiphilus sp.]
MTKSNFFIACFIAAGCSLIPLTTSAQKMDCDKAASSAEQDECADQELAMAETDLKDAFADAIQHYTPMADEQKENAALPKYDRDHEAQLEKKMRRDLEVSQKIWLQYRTAACAAVSDMYDGGTISPAATSLCKAEITKQRIKFLRDYFADDK